MLRHSKHAGKGLTHHISTTNNISNHPGEKAADGGDLGEKVAVAYINLTKAGKGLPENAGQGVLPVGGRFFPA